MDTIFDLVKHSKKYKSKKRHGLEILTNDFIWDIPTIYELNEFDNSILIAKKGNYNIYICFDDGSELSDVAIYREKIGDDVGENGC